MLEAGHTLTAREAEYVALLEQYWTTTFSMLENDTLRRMMTLQENEKFTALMAHVAGAQMNVLMDEDEAIETDRG